MLASPAAKKAKGSARLFKEGESFLRRVLGWDASPFSRRCKSGLLVKRRTRCRGLGKETTIGLTTECNICVERP